MSDQRTGKPSWAELDAMYTRAVHLAAEQRAEIDRLVATVRALQQREQDRLPVSQIQLLAWVTVNCHMLARRALARSTSVYDREKWEHVLRICEKAGARSMGVLRASLPTEITDGAEPPQQEPLDAD